MGRPQHRGEVAAKLARVADVERQQIEQVLARPAGLREPDRRDAQPFLPDLGGAGIVGAVGGAADIAEMGADDGPEQALVAGEYRHEDRQIGQMAAAVIGIVEQKHVAGHDVLEPVLDHQRRPGQRADMDREVIGLRDQAGPRVANRQRPFSWSPGLFFAAANGLALPFADASVDVAMCSFALHHLAPAEAAALLREMRRVARYGIVINDLVRWRPGYWATWLFTHALSRNPLTRNDGPLSVLRAYTRAEMRTLAAQAGLRDVRFDSFLGYRVAMTAT